MSFTPFTLLWILLALVVLGLIAYRKVVSSQEEEALHLDNLVEVNHQSQIAQKLEVIDKWGKLLTVITVVYGLALAGLYTYYTWLQGGARGGL
jgi:hypothetical protein